jgi:hypothetical protein
MYRKRDKYSRKLRAMREAKAKKRIEGPAPDYPIELPELRRRVIIIDYDFGKVVHRVDLYKSNRVDCYRAVVDGKQWKERVGWSKVLEAVRRGFIRVGGF